MSESYSKAQQCSSTHPQEELIISKKEENRSTDSGVGSFPVTSSGELERGQK